MSDKEDMEAVRARLRKKYKLPPTATNEEIDNAIAMNPDLPPGLATFMVMKEVAKNHLKK